MRKLTIAPLLVVPFLACGGDDGNNNKVSIKTDAKVYQDAPGGSGTGSCEANESYTGFLSGSGNGPFVDDYAATGSARHAQLVYGVISRDGSGKLDDVFEAEFDDGSGSGMFPNNIVTGTYTIDDSTTALPFWGIIPNYASAGSGAAFQQYFNNHAYWSVAATLTLTAEGGAGANVSGTFTNMMLVHYIAASDGSLTPANDDGSGGTCTTTINSISFAAVATDGNAKFAPHVTAVGPLHTEYKYNLPTRMLTNRHE